jgi:hypothetical protein
LSEEGIEVDGMEKKKNYDEQLSAIMNRLADSVLDMSDEQVVAEERGKGNDPIGEAESVRHVLRQASKKHRMKKLELAERVYQEQVAKIKKSEYELPASSIKRRELLAAVFAARPDVQSVMLTAQHRDFDQLTENDIESLLRQLADLGVLDSFK